MSKKFLIALPLIALAVFGIADAASAAPANSLPGVQNLNDILAKDPSKLGLADITSVLISIIQLFMSFVAVIAVLFVCVSGYQYVLAAGNPEKIEKAKMGLTWSIGGFILAVSAQAIVLLIQTVLQEHNDRRINTFNLQTSAPPEAADIIPAIFQAVLIFSGSITIIFLILGGYRYVTSQGNPELIDKAKKTVLYSVVGLGITFASYTIFILVRHAVSGT